MTDRKYYWVGHCQKSAYFSIAQRLLETTGILRVSSEAWNHKFNLFGVSLTKPCGGLFELPVAA